MIMKAMDSRPFQSVRCPKLIGRATPLALVGQLLDRVRAGQGQTLLLAGEAGMGKSRLVAELQQQTAVLGWPVAIGQCSQIEQAMPYAPLRDLLQRTAAQTPTQLAADLAAHIALPDRRRPPATYPELDQYQLVHLIVQFVGELTQQGPHVLIFEDLHWSDDATLALLPYLVQHSSNHPLLLVGTYRSDEIGPALEQCLVWLDRTPHVHEVHLTPLTRREVDLMLRAIFAQNGPVRTQFLDALYALTEGNPFYVEEALKSMMMAGDLLLVEGGVWTDRPLAEFHIPRSARHAVEQRTASINPAARAVLTLAAVAGRGFDFTLLQRLAGLDEAQLLNHLRELIEAQFLEETSADRLVFRHALTRQCIYSAVMLRERRRLHAAIAAELETLYGDQAAEHLGDLAYHCFAGERWAQALQYAQQAGEHALALFAPQTAVEQFSRAIEAAQHLTGGVPDHLYRQRGQAYALIGAVEAARQDYEQVLASAQAAQDRRAEWHLLIDLAQLWMTQDYARGGDYLTQAHQLAQATAQPDLVAHSLNSLGNWAMNQGRPFDAVQRHQEAQALFRAQHNDHGLAQTLDFLAIANYNCGDIAAGRAYYLDVLSRWRALHDARGLLHTLSGLSLAADFDLQVNDVPLAQHVAWAEEAVTVARRLGWQSGLVLTLICAALTQRHRGTPGTALALLHEALTRAEEIMHKEWMVDARVAIGATLLDLFAFDAAQAVLEPALTMAHAIDSKIWVGHASMTLAHVYTAQSAFAQAAALLDGLLGEALDVEENTSAPINGLQPRGLWFARAELVLAQDRPAQALTITTRLMAAIHPSNVPRLGLLHSQALLALGRNDAAARLLTASIDAARAQQRPHLLWRLLAVQAECDGRCGHGDAAISARAEARAIVDALAANLHAAAVPAAETYATQLQQQATARLTDRPAYGSTPPVQAYCGKLTPRECEVAALVAQGMTNRAIAGTLILSERTAERHIANIMNKLGCNTRAQIAAWYVTQVGQG